MGEQPLEVVSSGNTEARLWLSTILNIAITVVEAVAGVLAGSLALLADALHNFSDIAALLLVIVSRRLGQRPPSPKHTYGLKRLEAISAIINAAILLSVTIFIVEESLVRILHPQPVKAGLMFWAALAAFAANLASVFLLHHHDKRDLNVRSVFLHLIQDALASLVVVAAALFAHTSVGIYLDPIASLVVSFAVLYATVSIIVESFSIVSESVPRGVDIKEVVGRIDAKFAPARIHHVHLWEVGPGQRILTAHVAVPEIGVADTEDLFERIRGYLREEWSIGHATFEPEVGECRDPGVWDAPGEKR